MTYVFGPVPSRRLGLSLGVDVIPFKTCSFDCLYCQVGRTTSKTIDPAPFFSLPEIVNEIEKKLSKSTPDFITLAGSGEPTLNSLIKEIIQRIKGLTQTKVAVLTNGSLLWKEDVRQRILEADVIMPTLTSAYQGTFERIHRPHKDLDIDLIAKGLESLRQEYTGKVLLEVVLLAGINDSDEELGSLRGLAELLGPDKIQLNTVVRPPADPEARALESERLEYAEGFFGEHAEIIAETRVRDIGPKEDLAVMGELVEAVKRRPMRKMDLTGALGLPVEEVEELLEALLIKGYIRGRQYEGDTYYSSSEA